MRFVVDAMLGTLAKWMRILGYDTIYDPGLDDDAILDVAQREARVVVSRDRELCSRKPDSIHIPSTELEEQIHAIIGAWPPDGDAILSRCLECNSLLETASRGAAEGNVPEGVLERHSEFWHCRGCGRFYWRGTHWADMESRARALISCRNSPR